MLRSFLILPIFVLSIVSPTWSQTSEQIKQALSQRAIDVDHAWHEVQDYTEARVIPMPEVTTQKAWEDYIEGRREAALKKVIFRGAAAQWRDAKKKVEWQETIEGGAGYRIKKLRYEAIPGLWIPALLYEPENLKGKVPVVMNVNGHDGNGKSADYKQIRCINQAKRGMIALNVEWMGMGQLRTDGFNHYKSNQIDLCGTNGVATHYLYMTRGLDILLDHPNADSKRVAVAGLSGGGWQTIFISSLDQRVTLSNPVAGYSSYLTRARNISDLGDSEQTPVDLAMVADYSQLTAMRAPRPTLLTFNAQDQCCFKAGHALEPLMQAAQPVFDLYGKSDNLRSHVNEDPGTHNFLLDNRQQFYKMLGDHFFTSDASYSADEIDVEEELKTADELAVELPEENLDFHKIALKLMKDLPGPHILSIEGRRNGLANLLRIDSYQAQPVESQSIKIENGTARTVRFKLGSEWTVPATEFTPSKSPLSTILLLSDEGRSSTTEAVSQALQSGNRVIAIDPFYLGESKISKRDYLYGLLVSSVGERPLGIQSAQLTAIGNWAKSEYSGNVSVRSFGKRTGLIALTSAALNPELFKKLEITGGMKSLKEIIEQDLAVTAGPELFTFGLLESFDIPEITGLAQPCEVVLKAATEKGSASK